MQSVNTNIISRTFQEILFFFVMQNNAFVPFLKETWFFFSIDEICLLFTYSQMQFFKCFIENNIFFCFLRLMDHFYAEKDHSKACFPGERTIMPLELKSTVPSFLLYGGIFAACMSCEQTRSFYWKFSSVCFVIGMMYGAVRSW